MHLIDIPAIAELLGVPPTTLRGRIEAGMSADAWGSGGAAKKPARIDSGG
jgi:hypothetical protein